MPKKNIFFIYNKMSKNALELFSGTHSVGKVIKNKGYKVVSLDRDLGAECPFSDYKSEKHFKEDILTWDYKQYPVGYFDLITASPVCLWWSSLRRTWIGRKCKSIHPTDIITMEHIQSHIDLYGKPMVDKVMEIIDYFKPKYWWIENPQTGLMKHYIEEKYPDKNMFYDFDYCKYSDWGYKKRTRFWTNIPDIIPKKCKMDCDNIIIIKTQKGDKRGSEPIKGDTRKLHTGNIACGRNGKSIKSAIEKGEVEQRIHKRSVNNNLNARIEVDGKLITCNTAELRKKYRKQLDEQSAKRKFHKKSFGSYNKDQTCVGGGTSRLERYRIPEKLIEDLIKNI